MADQLNLFRPETEKEIAEKQMIKVAKQPDSRGMFQKAVKAEEAAYKKRQTASKQPTAAVTAKKEKPYYMQNLGTGKLEDVNNPGSSLYPTKTRLETMPERMQRMMFLYEDGDKPAHFDDPNIIDYENNKKIPKPFKSDDKSTYPSTRDQRQKLNNWELIVATANSPAQKKEVREILREDFKKTKGKYMSPKELRMIGRHPDQLKPIVIPTPAPVAVAPRPIQPQIPIEDIIRQRADENLYQQQQQHDMQFGKGGLAALSRPKK